MKKAEERSAYSKVHIQEVEATFSEVMTTQGTRKTACGTLLPACPLEFSYNLEEKDSVS